MGGIAPYELVLLVSPFVVLIVAWWVGRTIDRRHLARLRVRDERLGWMPAVNLGPESVPRDVLGAMLVTGSVVISIDYYKRFVGQLRNLVGGRIRSWETLLERARREALLRMKEQAAARGFHAVVNVRFETSTIARGNSSQKGVAGVEIIAFGTALRLQGANGPR